MKRRIAALTLITAALYGGFFIAAHQAFSDESWPEW